MRFAFAFCLLATSVCSLGGQTIEVGTGAPNEYIRVLFQNAFSRGVFSRFAALPPVGAVRRYGSTGLIQEFNDSTKTSGRMALVKSTALADENNPYGDVYQILSDLFSYYSSVGVNTAGYPTGDTQLCPSAACQYQYFDRRYILFAFSAAANDPQNITVRDPFYTRFEFFGGVPKMGPALTAETAVTSSFGGNATAQTFREGILYNITSGDLAGRLVSVRQPIWALYQARGMHSGPLGYPTGDEVTLPGGKRRQVFEGGSIEYDDNNPPVVRTPVRSVQLRPSTTPVRLNAGESMTFEAVVYGADDSELTDRVVNFTTNNSRVISVQASGSRATVRAVGAGAARLSATSEGKTSTPVDFIVTAQCCAVGEGAPSAAIQQAFQDVVTRNRLSLRLPGPERVRRAGSGYLQEFQDPGGTRRYVIAMADRSAQAFYLTGALLARWEELGGATSPLGYPVSDPVAPGRQLFENGALAGNPLRVVSGAVLARWAQDGYEAGPAGLPTGDAAAVISFAGTAGVMQAFTGGVIAGSPRGAFLVAGAIARKYAELEAASGVLGLPTGEETGSGSVRRQEFEGGLIEWTPGAGQANFTARERRPAVAANPSAVLPGTRVRLTVSGFPEGATVRVSQTGQPDFLVQTASGAYTWESLVPVTAAPGTVRVRAVDPGNGALSAETTYQIRTAAEARVVLAKAAGDTQSGPPGAVLAAPLRVSLRDGAGNPVAGMTVRFTASPGAAVNPETATTDAAGFAETRLRLPDADGVALVTAEAARQVVTFSARSAGASILHFPRLTTASTEAVGFGRTPLAEGGALLSAAASILRYYQNRGELPQPNGAADPETLNAYLKRACFTDAFGVQVCDGFLNRPGSGEYIANLWRLPAFVGGQLEVSVERAEIPAIRGLVAGGSPVLVALSMGASDAAMSHFVVATGIASDGSIQIHDPLPAGAGRTRLEDYLAGDTNGQARIAGAIRLLPRPPAGTGFVVTSFDSEIAIHSRSGECGQLMLWPETPARAGVRSGSGGILRLRACDGAESEYQIELQGGSLQRAFVTDFSDGGPKTEIAGGRVAAFRAHRPASLLVVEPQQTTLAARGAVVNAATFTSDIAPGGLASVFGAGLARAGATTHVEVSGRAAAVVASMPFQVNVQIPPELPPGSHLLRVETPYGSAEQTIEVQAVAPEIFRAGSDFRRGVVVNQDGRLNGITSPARRGEAVVIYGTGMGATAQAGATAPVQTPVTVLLGGQELRPSYAGLTPGFVGLYQVNLVIPVTFPPGLDLQLLLRQGGVESIPVEISVQ